MSGTAAKPPMPLAVVEQIKLQATWLNNLGGNLIIVGFVTPFAAYVVNSGIWSWPASLVMVVYTLAGVVFHRFGIVTLAGLK